MKFKEYLLEQAWKWKNFDEWYNDLVQLDKKLGISKKDKDVKEYIADKAETKEFYNSRNTPCEALATMINNMDPDFSICK